MKYSLTHGAQRAIQQARQLAGDCGHPLAESVHLLHVLMSEEIAASAALRAFEISRELLQKELPLEEKSQDDSPDSKKFAAVTTTVSDQLLEVLHSASLAMSRDDTNHELNSEHLLIGMVEVESPAAQFLQARKVTRSALEIHFYGAPAAKPAPLAVDLELQTDATDYHRQIAARVIDAAANRLREGIRTIEDYVRFVMDDKSLTDLTKKCRHRFADAISLLDSQQLLAARETTGDVGTDITTVNESNRTVLTDVLTAAFKRVQEAARSLEEFGKLLDVNFAEAVKQIRYKIYTLEQTTLRITSAQKLLQDRNLYLLITSDQCDHDWQTVVHEAIANGVSIIQLREKSLSDQEIIQRGRWLRNVTAAAGVLMIMNDRPDLAVLTNADGVHVGQDEMSVRDARRIVGTDRLVGLSTHSIDQARSAVSAGADYIGVGPCFPSTTKQFTEFPGLDFVKEVAAEITLPWFPIGGINADNLPRLLKSGATRIAVSAAISRAKNVAAASRNLKDQLQRGDEAN